MSIELEGERLEASVVVRGLPDLPGWTVEVHDDGRVLVTPAAGERLAQPAARRMPWGSIQDAADRLSRADRLARLVAEGPELQHEDRVPGERRTSTVVGWYRRALGAGLVPRDVLSAVYGLPGHTVGTYITEARAAGALGPLQAERDRIAGRTR